MNPARDTPLAPADRRTRTGSWIISAFNQLALRRPYESVGVAGVSRRAGVGRSTFYEHFDGKDDLLRQALRPVLMPLADAAVGAGDTRRVRALADHLAQNRPRTLAMLDGAARVQVERALAEMILARIPATPPGIDASARGLFAAQIAGSQLALLRAWLAGGIAACPPSRVAAMLLDTTARMTSATR